MFVRWSNLSLSEEEQRRLPGYRDEAIVRRFDAPEALQTRFYEVRARSVLNRVPKQSRMPFRWTINPYRGCSHACTYCLSPDTQILMADGRSKRMGDLAIGDWVYGTVREGDHRRFTATQVKDKWSSIKPAYSVDVADGSRLIASGDHRFLTRRGWKHVIGSEWGPLQRPHLTPGSRLLGPGGCVPGLGTALKAAAQLDVEAIRPLGMTMRLYDITTGTGDFIANGVVSHNCFARPTHKYLGFDAGRDFEREIVVKVNAPEVLRAELARPSWKREHVALGTNTDPYQWVEGRYKLMQGIWEALRDAANPCSVLTKSPLLLRDLPLMLQIARAHELRRVPVDPHARREGVARDRAAHAQPAGAPGGGGRAQPRGHPDRRADRAADARDQRLAGRRSRSCWSSRPRRARRASAASRCTCAARCARCSWAGCASSARTSWSATSGSTAAAHTRRRRNASACRGWCIAAGSRSASCRSAPDAARRADASAPRPCRRHSRRCSELAHAGLAGGHFVGDLVAAGAAADGRAELRCDARDRRAEAHGQRGDVDLALVALDPADRRARDVLGRARADAVAGSSAPASANMPASRMKPGMTVVTPTPLPRRSMRRPAAKPRRPNLVVVYISETGVAALPLSEDM